MSPADPHALPPAPQASATIEAGDTSLARFLADRLDGLCRAAHEQALERMADDTEMMLSGRAVRIAMYRSLRQFRRREPELRLDFVQGVLAQRSSGGADEWRPRVLRLLHGQELRQELLCATFIAQIEGVTQPVLAAFASARAAFDGEGAGLAVAIAPRRLLGAYLRALARMPVEPELRIALLRCLHAQMLARLPELHRDTLARLRDEAIAPLRDDGTGWSAHGAELTPVVPVAAQDDLARDACNAWSAQQIIRALLILQSALRHADDPVATGASPSLRELVESALYRQHAARGSRATFRDEERAAIDMIDMLFGALIDASMPAPLAAELCKLRVPYLRLVLEDREALLYRESPARDLLEALVRAASQPGPEGAPATALAALLRNVVREVLASFDEGDAALREVLASFERQWERLCEPVRRVERRVIERAESRDRLARSWTEVARYLRRELEQCDLPRLVRELLRRPWAQYMSLLALRHGATAPGFLDAVAVANRLCAAFGDWSASTPATPAAAQQGMHRLASVAIELRTGLERVGYAPQQVVEVWQALTRLLVDGRSAATCATLIRDEGHDIDSALHEFALPGTDAASGDTVAMAPAPPAASTDATEAVPRALDVGALVELHIAAQPPQRLKLCWRSVGSGWHVFVNMAGVKSLELPARRVADMLADGSLVPLAATPLVERALLGIADRLQGSAPLPPPSTDGSSA